MIKACYSLVIKVTGIVLEWEVCGCIHHWKLQETMLKSGYIKQNYQSLK